MKYAEMDWGTMEAVVNKLGGMDGVKRFLSGELIVSTAQKVWKTLCSIKLGTSLKSADDFRTALKKANCGISDYANQILGKPAFTASTEKKEVELVVVSVAELGFRNGATRADIYKRAQEFGLDLCPAEVGPQTALQYGKEIKSGEWFLIGMEPISDSGGDLGVFGVERGSDGGLWLDTFCDDSGGVWGADDRWVFVRRK